MQRYADEIERLKGYPSTDYIGYYSVTEEKTYELLAINADEYNGFVYALTDGKNRIIYAEQIFCNYFMDLEYKEYIPEEYLLDGFDATMDNPYRKIKMNGWVSMIDRTGTYRYYNEMMWPGRFASCISVEDAIKMM